MQVNPIFGKHRAGSNINMNEEKIQISARILANMRGIFFALIIL